MQQRCQQYGEKNDPCHRAECSRHIPGVNKHTGEAALLLKFKSQGDAWFAYWPRMRQFAIDDHDHRVQTGAMSAITSITRSLLLSGMSFILTACGAVLDDESTNRDPERLSRATLTQVAYRALSTIQPASIQHGREYCGYILLTKQGELIASSINAGGADWCVMPTSDLVDQENPGSVIVADFHTHASYEAHEDSEVPSARDMSGNRAANIIGFLGTPGGRFWVIAPDGLSAEQLCATPCLPMDPNFEPPDDDQRIPNFLSYRQVLRRQM